MTPAALVFGPQTTLPSPELADQLRAALLLNPRLYPLRAAIESLPLMWPVLLAADPALTAVPGQKSLQQLSYWLSHGEFPRAKETSDLPATLVTPLTMVVHLVQYLLYIDEAEANPGRTHDDILSHVRDRGGVQGLCTGLLSAVAVATSPDLDTLWCQACVVLRIAVVIGAYVDLDLVDANVTSMVVRSRIANKDTLTECLKKIPGAYISVVTEESSSTITVPTESLNAIAQSLASKGFTLKQVDLRGRFHHSRHTRYFERLRHLIASNPDFQLETGTLLAPVYSNIDGKPLRPQSFQDTVLQSILIQQCEWYTSISAAFVGIGKDERPEVVQFGLVDCIPSSLQRHARVSIRKIVGVPGPAFQPYTKGSLPLGTGLSSSREPIAVIGMACKFPGADSLEEYWQLLAQGTSMCRTMPETRFKSTGLRRSPDDRFKLWGNFISHIDAFDHHFFNKSSREAASMDPQQRLLLQVAYQALESAEYFGPCASKASQDVGCYLGLCASDYTDNVASHPPNAFSSVGTLRAFMSGKISHFFGWTGPSITYDTACSSSAVAIQAACRALQTGECSMALAGGVSLYTSPNFYQNLAAASFLSPTGPSKPFDAKADGYCRGEGVGLVLLKPLSAAMADNDNNNVMGVIAAAAVNQNQNSTTITVPHSESQIALYHKVLAEAGLDPHDISFVEAHGTGTPVGDPIEFASIHKVFGGSNHIDPLAVSSVKGNIGHTEGASGVASLIKTILMLQRGIIPVQANHTTLNPKIAPLDNITIPLTTYPWTANFKAACINNYGAAGSNAAMIVHEAPVARQPRQVLLTKYPIYISGNTPSSLKAYCVELLRILDSKATDNASFLSSLAFHLANKQNRNFPHAFITSVSSKAELQKELSSVVQGQSPLLQTVSPEERPVVLVFGGQSSRSVRLSRQVYESSAILRSHLTNCDGILRASGLKGIFPAIFQKGPITDVVLLHSACFSVQYACAMSWIDSGLVPATLIGHSLGQLTALTISGILSVEDGLKLVTERAKLIEKAWDSGQDSTISVQADIHTVTRLKRLAESENQEDGLEIACFNGRSEHVVVGSRDAIGRLQVILAQESVQHKQLDVPHGFHSKTTEPLLAGLKECAARLNFRYPQIPIETCSQHSSWTQFDASMIVQHTQTPIYFAESVNRLSGCLGPFTWLEAGTGSSVTDMVQSALDSSTGHHFQQIQLGDDNAMGLLADATVDLWKFAHKVQFWPFNPIERSSFSSLDLPPYQFEKTRHWLEWKDTVSEQIESTSSSSYNRDVSTELLSFIGYSDSSKKQAEFRISTRHEKYAYFVKGHAVVGQPLCPAPLYIDLARRGAKIMSENTHASEIIPSIEDLEIQAPLGASDRAVTLRIQKSARSKHSWTFTFSSNPSCKSTDEQLHASGTLVLQENNPESEADFARYGRLVSNKRYEEMIVNLDTPALQSPILYQMFSKAVTYAEYYKGVQSVYSLGHEVTGRVRLPATVQDVDSRRALLLDNFIQVAGIHINCLSKTGSKEVYVCTKVDRLQAGATFEDETADASASWMVHSSYHPVSDKEVVNDIFVFHEATGELALFILGALFTKVIISSLVRALSRANGAGGASIKSSTPERNPVLQKAPPIVLSPGIATKSSDIPDNAYLLSRLKESLSRVIEVPVADIHDNDLLDEIGVDSLLGTEVLHEINQSFHVSIPPDVFAALTTVSSILKVLVTCLGAQGSGLQTKPVDSEDSGSDIATGVITSGMTTPDDPISRLADLVAEHLECDIPITSTSNLADLGLDSILCIELVTDIKKMFECDINMAQLNIQSTFSNLVGLVLPDLGHSVLATLPAVPTTTDLHKLPQAFEQIQFDYDIYSNQTGFYGFWDKVYPSQAKLVLAYTVQAFAQLGCNLATMQPGEKIPLIKYLPNYEKLVQQLYNVLRDGMLIATGETGLVRTDKPVDATPASQLLDAIIAKAPQHSSEHRLLNITGSKLSGCLSGTIDPLNLLFQSKANKDLLAEVYLHGPMYAAISNLLCQFLGNALSRRSSSGAFHILELGGGTGGTTGHILDHLVRCGIQFTYTFSDISGSFVTAARRKFAGRDYMKYQVIDIEKDPGGSLVGKYHAIISTNCIHATRNLEVSTRNIHRMLRPDGFTALVEFTRNLYWFDLVFGLLEGWWLFEDGRRHVIASTDFWDQSMRKAGFQRVSWTDGDSMEARTLRIIAGFKEVPLDNSLTPKQPSHDNESAMETVLYKQVNQTPLFADIYYPPTISDTPRPVALMIHGGGHVMLSRKDIRLKQTAYLHSLGFLPVSIDYRLCPETTLPDGLMCDVSDALAWARNTLPSLPLLCPDLRIDASRIVVLGWSTGGHLAMTTAFTSIERGLAPPDAILAFYCPTDYEDAVWSQPNYPENTENHDMSNLKYNLLDGVQKHPITAYNVSSSKAVGGWMAPGDPRSRIILHMNWKGQSLPILLRGLPTPDSISRSKAEKLISQPQPNTEEIQRVSPYAQIKKGVYRTPTFIIHGSEDDLIPWEQSVRTIEALKAKGVSAGVIVPQGKKHLFDLYGDVDGSGWEVVKQGYDFVANIIFEKN
ncbi:uncharacterized protein BDV14DRAFT_201678 [Aspergillus stella-maris]|uniref:uncharacterized protein n=1 Tax=Aspergillus stella-maris TaxID=1810926 RepID=UPI003CCE2AAE